jgi:hypothetical protein
LGLLYLDSQRLGEDEAATLAAVTAIAELTATYLDSR